MTINDMLQDGIAIQGVIKIQGWIGDTLTVYYEGNAEWLCECDISECRIVYMFPYVGNEPGICFEIDTE